MMLKELEDKIGNPIYVRVAAYLQMKLPFEQIMPDGEYFQRFEARIILCRLLFPGGGFPGYANAFLKAAKAVRSGDDALKLLELARNEEQRELAVEMILEKAYFADGLVYLYQKTTDFKLKDVLEKRAFKTAGKDDNKMILLVRSLAHFQVYGEFTKNALIRLGKLVD